MNFDDAVEHILRFEGGGAVTKDARDPGGTTKFGISQRAYPLLDIENLTRTQAVDIYLRDYWCVCRADEMPCQIRLLVFDACVNQGPHAAITMLQNVLGVDADGIVGAHTIQACWLYEPQVIATRFAAARYARYLKNEGFTVYGKGWIHRLLEVAVLSSAVPRTDHV